MRLRTTLATAGAAASLVVTGLITAGPANAAVLACGSTVTQSTTLTANVGPCTGDGLIITKSNVTLNLNGFKVTGKKRPGDQAGIRVVNTANPPAGLTGVTIRNGTVTGFDAGVVIFGGSGNTVTGMTVQNNVNDLRDGDCDLGDGINLTNSDNNTVSSNNVVGNGPFGGISLVGDSDGNQIKNNTLVGNNIPGALGCGNGGFGNENEGVRIEGPGANGNVVNNNNVSQSGIAGIGVHANVGCRNNPQPTDEPNNDFNTITNNTVTGSANAGESDGIKVLEVGPFGTVVCAAANLTITGNTSSNNERNGIEIPATSVNNTINNNTVNANGQDGIHLEGPIFTNTFTDIGPTVLDLITPNQPTFTAGTDFAALSGSGSGDVTGKLVAIGPIDVTAPIPFDQSASGCTAADFTNAGFQPGDIALIQRGFCDRSLKVQNAIDAGASAVVFFNEGSPGREGLIVAGVNPVNIPVVDATFATGQALFNATQAGPVTIHVATNTTNVRTQVNVGAENNTLNANTGFNNAQVDGRDDNPHCDNNHWIANNFGTVNQRCVKANGGTGAVKPIV
ncbi:MAG: hypothetical protein V7605_1021 [Acidimicrobiaceae bacterium]|jgi:parallel beta-helix repeat protein